MFESFDPESSDSEPVPLVDRKHSSTLCPRRGCKTSNEAPGMSSGVRERDGGHELFDL